MYKNEYENYDDLQIMEFKDEIALLFHTIKQVENGVECVSILANKELVTYLMELAFDQDYDIKYFSDKDENRYCIELDSCKNLRIIPYNTYAFYGKEIYIYQASFDKNMVKYIMGDYENCILFGFEGEN